MMKQALASLTLLLAALPAMADIADLLPPVKELTETDAGSFALTRAVRLSDPTDGALLREVMADAGLTADPGAAASLTVTLVDEIPGAYDYELRGYPNEAYTISVSADAIRIQAVTPTGAIRAAQTLRQLAMGVDAIPALTITDWPAFKLRGYMHDVGRSFISFDELKHQVDMMSRFKINTFHWHLTENQAWRFEVKAYPELTSAASMTRFAGSYYTQEQCRELEAYAAERGVTVIPEIDMPGHSQAFERAMGHSMQTAQGVAELQTILGEVAEAFPLAPYIHIGADEQTISYPDFLKTMTDRVHSLGKLVVCWNPIRGVSISKAAGFDMTQMWSTAGQAVAGIPNIDCRYNYTNHFDVFADPVGIYKSNVYYAQQGSPDVAGEISAPWNDRKTPTEGDIIRQNNIYFNAIASAERAWKGGGCQYIEQGGTTLPNSGEEYEEFADFERRFLRHKATTLSAEDIPYVRQTDVRWRISDAFPNGGNADAVFPPETEGLVESWEHGGKTYSSRAATGAGIYLSHTWGSTVPAFFANPQQQTTAYAWTYVHSPLEQDAGALIEFHNYGRSEKDLAPEAGKWDRRGSRIFLNDEEILPPVWTNTGRSIDNEVDLANENFTARKPTAIHLRQGWNKVFLKLPFNPDNGVRLKKWMFTFVITDPEGRDALDGLIYSPGQYMSADAELLSAAISEARSLMAEYISDAPGYYPASLADEINAVIGEIEAELREGSGDSASQLARLDAAIAAFRESLASAQVNLPLLSNDDVSYYYYLYTPERSNRYATVSGAASMPLISSEKPGTRSRWRFTLRPDGTFNIQNAHKDSYLSPDAANNTQLHCSSTEPDAGWELKLADTGLFAITSGTSQLNQTNAGLKWVVYNWGSGTNLTDTGCRYRIELAETVEHSAIREIESDDAPALIYDLQGRRVPTPARPGLYIRRGQKTLLP